MRERWRLGDTLFVRLFVLMWVALVVSHLVAYFVYHAVTRPLPEAPPRPAGLPTLPSLPPFSVPSNSGRVGPPAPPPEVAAQRNGVEPHASAASSEASARPDAALGPPPGHEPAAGPRRHPMLWIDYAVRLLVIGLFAAVGARWLSTPMRRLADASRTLGDSLGRGAAPASLDATRGSVEVRETAQVFNQMVRRLREQFESRSLFMAAISHDLRTPLTRVRLRLEQRRADPVIEAGIDDLREMDALIEAALATLRDERTQEAARALDVFALVQSLVDDEVELGHCARVEGEAAVVHAQPTALRRAIGNLLANALRYGGSAAVSVRRDDGRVSIRIDDCGPGIAPEQLESVFQPFHRLDAARSRAAGGSGLGLYIARELTQRNGGTLVLINRPEGGLRAQIVLSAA